jgi:hypothetical protein
VLRSMATRRAQKLSSRIFTKPGAGQRLATGTRRHPSQGGNSALFKAYDISMRRFPWLLILSRS